MTAILLLVLVLGAALGLCGWLFPQALVETARRPLRRLERISAPTLLIWSARDRITHVSSVRRFESGIRDCRTVILEDCGHVPYLEKKAETREACREFLAAVGTL